MDFPPHVEGYYKGMKWVLERVDALARLHSRKRTLMNSTQGDVFYNAKEEWNNFDIMDIVSLCLCSYPQQIHGGRQGLLIRCHFGYTST